MAYMDQDRKRKIAPKIKSLLVQYGMVGSLAVHNHSTLVLNLREGQLDFIGNYNRKAQKDGPDYWGDIRQAKDHISVNPYHMDKAFTGTCLKFLEECRAAMMDGNWDRSDIQTDYFDVGWYVEINIGKWNKPYHHIEI